LISIISHFIQRFIW